MKTVGYRLKHRRIELGLNQRVVAEVAGVTNAAVSKWETNGGASMSAVIALRLSRFLNVNPFWLICGEGEPAEKLRVTEFTAGARSLAGRIDRLPPRLRELMDELLAAIRA